MQYTVIKHSAKGSTWKDHKYIAVKNGRYIYPEDTRGKARSHESESAQVRFTDKKITPKKEAITTNNEFKMPGVTRTVSNNNNYTDEEWKQNQAIKDRQRVIKKTKKTMDKMEKTLVKNKQRTIEKTQKTLDKMKKTMARDERRNERKAAISNGTYRHYATERARKTVATALRALSKFFRG